MFKKTKNVWIFLAVVILWIAMIQWYMLNEAETWEKVSEKTEASLSAFVEFYNSWSFEKIEVVNDKDLIWYILLTGNDKMKEYHTVESEKPENTSLSDIWIEVLWNSRIVVKTE